MDQIVLYDHNMPRARKTKDISRVALSSSRYSSLSSLAYTLTWVSLTCILSPALYATLPSVDPPLAALLRKFAFMILFAANALDQVKNLSALIMSLLAHHSCDRSK